MESWRWNTPTINNITAGAYTATITDANGCTSSTTVVVNNTGGAKCHWTSSTDVTCAGASNGSANVNVSRGTALYMPGLSFRRICFQCQWFIRRKLYSDSNWWQWLSECSLRHHSEPAGNCLQTSSTGTACGGSTGTASVIAAGGGRALPLIHGLLVLRLLQQRVDWQVATIQLL